MIKKADIVIAHSGVGSIISALSSNKPVVVFPRLAKYKEHIDDHQLDIAHAFSHKNYCLCCEEDDDLLEKINQCRVMKFDKYVSQRERIVGIITNYLVKC
jgi:UDP-N-acetylglucosamine transferase subunit ALG13